MYLQGVLHCRKATTLKVRQIKPGHTLENKKPACHFFLPSGHMRILYIYGKLIQQKGMY